MADPDLETHYSALDNCRTAIKRAAGQYEDTLTERNPGEITYGDDGAPVNNRTPVAAATFGDLTDSGALATAANDVWDAVITETDQARRKLRAVEHALSTVEENIRAAHGAGS
ncbi:hypothetical protein HCN51_53910 [Nonomuraea sp. FMUSA5-5]|uniref:Uncharacterized protein n=1 Tax=Nonomuraea composti TaxID=2720023 RepID=A0ABX1BKI0_9ACTN|nr:hypothetical protein [Nonomuraea sp. FMUSA5-5]NJP98229.1 hypothetical protein [Nonomuraea sp. FMUSA5-5]